jgi:hypothetical protein
MSDKHPQCIHPLVLQVLEDLTEREDGYFLAQMRLQLGQGVINMHCEVIEVWTGVNKADQKVIHARNKKFDPKVAQYLGSAAPFNVVAALPETIHHRGKEYLVFISPYQE